MVMFWNCAGAPPPPEPEPIASIPDSIAIVPEPVIDIPPTPPQSVAIQSVTYNREQMKIIWEPSLDPDFKNYTLLYLNTENGIADTLVIYTDISMIDYNFKNFDPKIENWFWVKVTNNYNLSSDGTRQTHELETESPNSSLLRLLNGKDDIRICWTKNNDEDFLKYNIYRSKNKDMLNKEHIKEVFKQSDTVQVLAMDSVFFYQIGVEDVWGLESISNIIKGDYYIELWGEDYSIIETKELDFSSRNLFGTIPQEFGKFLNLEVLLLQNNYLSGNIPDAIWKLRKLKVFNLSNNQFKSKIPEGIHKLYSLEELWMSNNGFMGEIPYQVFTLNNLTHLNLSSNQFSGNLSEAVGNLNNLVYLNLYDNRLTGFIPIEIGKLRKLEFLSLGENWFTGNIPIELTNAKNLQSLALFNNQLVGSIPGQIKLLKNLKYLSIFGNRLNGEVPVELFTDLNLSYLKLNNNLLDQIDIQSICESGYDWNKIMYYDLSENAFEEELPICFPEPNFFELYTSFNKK